jgi:hypothetical protein
VDLMRTAAGACSGDGSIPQQGARDLPLTDVRVAGDSLRFTIGGVPGTPTFAGVRQADASVVTGTFTQGSERLAFEMRTAASPADRAREPLAGFDMGKLVDEGRLQRNVPLRTYLPWSRMADEGVAARLAPRGMSRTNFSVAESKRDADHAEPDRTRGDTIERIPLRDISLVGPAGSINSTIEDMTKWVGLHLAGGGGSATVSLVRDTVELEYHGIRAKLRHWHYDTFQALRNPDDPTLENAFVTFRTAPDGSVEGALVFVEDRAGAVTGCRCGSRTGCWRRSGRSRDARGGLRRSTGER